MTRLFTPTAAIFALLWPITPAEAQIPLPKSHKKTYNQSTYDCQGLALQAASGVPKGPVHAYKFAGPCKILSVGVTDATITSTKVEGTVWAKASVIWASKTGALKESILVTGDWSGKLEMTLTCAKDPIISAATCVHGQYVNETGWPGFDLAWIDSHPITQGRTNAFSAAAMSMEAAKQTPESGAAVPPPPKAGGVKDPPNKYAQIAKAVDAVHHVVEGEQLVSGAVPNNGEPAHVQDMTQFGTAWSGNAQLFWAAQNVGARLQLRIPLTLAGRYEVFVAFTQAPDYGLIEASFDGQPSVHFNGYAAAVSRNRALLGMFDLTPGDHQLVLTVAGKDGSSSGYYLGLDRVEFERR